MSIEQSFETPEPTPENLTAILTCLGAKTSSEDSDFILQRQNPFRQKRGGLGFGAYSVVKFPGGGSSFSNINVFNEQAKTSPLTLKITDQESGRFILNDEDKDTCASGTILPIPEWGSKILSTGKPAITVLQQHGPVNLVGILGSPTCSLFEKGNVCEFCMMNGGATNEDRSVQEIVEAYELAKQDKAAYNLTLTTGFQASQGEVEKTIAAVAELKRKLGCTPIALEVTPFEEKSMERIRALKEVGLDTFMMPLDCASEEAQKKYLPGKATLLGDVFWENARNAVEVFGRGNVTSSIIVGLEPLEETLQAIERMLQTGVIPEPVPVRWDDSKLSTNFLPLTNPEDLMKAREAIRIIVEQEGFAQIMEKTRAGCAACGGCGGIVVNNLPKPRSLRILQ